MRRSDAARSGTTSPIMPASPRQPPPFRHRSPEPLGRRGSRCPAAAMSRLSGGWDGAGGDVQLLLDLWVPGEAGGMRAGPLAAALPRGGRGDKGVTGLSARLWGLGGGQGGWQTAGRRWGRGGRRVAGWSSTSLCVEGWQNTPALCLDPCTVVCFGFLFHQAPWCLGGS